MRNELVVEEQKNGETEIFKVKKMSKTHVKITPQMK